MDESGNFNTVQYRQLYRLLWQNCSKRAEGLRCNHMVTFLGSDAHCLESRNTDMREAGRAIHKLDNKKVDTLTACEHNAATVLQDKVLYPELPKQWKKPHSGFLSRFLHTFSLI